MKFAWLALLVATTALSACSTATSATSPSGSAQSGVVYAAIGASETYGVGADDRYRQAWPQIFYSDALPVSSTFYNLGIPAETTAQALKDEVPTALSVHPNVVTVWLNVNDLVQGVPAVTYGSQLRQLVHALRQGKKARVLVANTPDLRLLPAYRACADPATDSGACPLPASLVPSAQQLGELINAYNQEVATVVKQEGATLVDLYSRDALIAQHPDWISSDGFHPNGQGYVQIAKTFEAAYGKAG